MITIKQYEQAADEKVSIGGIKWQKKWDVCIQCDSREEAEAVKKRFAETEQAVRKPLTNGEIRKWWGSENGLEDCVMANLDDFTQVVRAIEAAHGIKENT